jgi:hypothetical protein
MKTPNFPHDAPKDVQGLPIFIRRIESLRADIELAKRRKQIFERFRWTVPLTGVVVGALAIGGGIAATKPVFEILGAIWLVLGVLFPLFGFDASIATEIESMESELALISTGTEAIEQRAERLFRTHEIDVRRYYQQTLRHSSLIFITGIVCIVLGFAIIGFSFYAIWIDRSNGEDFDQKILIASFGIASGVLSNFIAIVYLRMFSETLKSLTEFHQKLVSTNHLYFSNFLLTKISSADLRDRVLSDIALRVSQPNGENNASRPAS